MALVISAGVGTVRSWMEACSVLFFSDHSPRGSLVHELEEIVVRGLRPEYIQTVWFTIREGICSESTQAEGPEDLLQVHSWGLREYCLRSKVVCDLNGIQPYNG